jgi:ribosomal protein L37AE/L43A
MNNRRFPPPWTVEEQEARPALRIVENHTACLTTTARLGAYAKHMLIAVICPSCQHRGYVAERMLSRILCCSRCRHHGFFKRGAAVRPAPAMIDKTDGGSLMERALLPPDLVPSLWDDQSC